MKRLVSIALCWIVCGISCGSQPLDLPQDDFKYSLSNPPFVHPRIIQDLSTWLSDTGDQVVCINLLDSQDSNLYHGEIEIREVEDQDPFVFSREGKAMFGYSYVGMAGNGIHVLCTANSGGGSGTFYHLMLITIERDIGLATDYEKGTIEFSRSRLLIKKIGEIGLGDRWDGEHKVEGNRLYIGKDLGWFSERTDYPNAGQKLIGWHDLSAFKDQE